MQSVESWYWTDLADSTKWHRVWHTESPKRHQERRAESASRSRAYLWSPQIRSWHWAIVWPLRASVPVAMHTTLWAAGGVKTEAQKVCQQVFPASYKHVVGEKLVRSGQSGGKLRQASQSDGTRQTIPVAENEVHVEWGARGHAQQGGDHGGHQAPKFSAWWGLLAN